MQKKYLLFDLDGTLTDSKLGITRCVQYALKSLGIDEPDLDKLECYIGPPLIDSFQRYHGLSLEQAQMGVAKYRERFRDTGILKRSDCGNPGSFRGIKEARLCHGAGNI